MRSLSALIAGVLVLAGCSQPSNAPAPQASAAKPLTHVRFALGNPIINPGLSYTWIGSYFGWYQNEGIELEIVPTQGTADATQRVAVGQVEFALPPPSVYVTSLANGQDLGLISIYLLRRHGQYSFGVKNESPIRELGDLKGKRIGVTSLGDEGVTYSKAAARELGFNESDFQLVPVGAAGEAASILQKGDVDALALPGVQYALVESLGIKLRHLPNPAFAAHIFGNEIVGKRDYIQQHPDIARGLVRGFAMGQAFFMANPKAALQISFKMFPQTVPSGKTVAQAVEDEVAALPPNIETLKFEDKPCKKWGCNSEEDWKAYVAYLGIEEGKVGDISKLFTNEFVDYANTFDQAAVEQQAKTFVLTS
jgi:NitT/TauT family transport system substrate-binding protein